VLGGGFSAADIARALVPFAKSSGVRDAAAILRAMDRGLIPADAAAAFVAEIPTGSEDVGTEITVTA
jgi:hypothetical protein